MCHEIWFTQRNTRCRKRPTASSPSTPLHRQGARSCKCVSQLTSPLSLGSTSRIRFDRISGFWRDIIWRQPNVSVHTYLEFADARVIVLAPLHISIKVLSFPSIDQDGGRKVGSCQPSGLASVSAYDVNLDGKSFYLPMMTINVGLAHALGRCWSAWEGYV